MFFCFCFSFRSSAKCLLENQLKADRRIRSFREHDFEVQIRASLFIHVLFWGWTVCPLAAAFRQETLLSPRHNNKTKFCIFVCAGYAWSMIRMPLMNTSEAIYRRDTNSLSWSTSCCARERRLSHLSTKIDIKIVVKENRLLRVSTQAKPSTGRM